MTPGSICDALSVYCYFVRQPGIVHLIHFTRHRARTELIYTLRDKEMGSHSHMSPHFQKACFTQSKGRAVEHESALCSVEGKEAHAARLVPDIGVGDERARRAHAPMSMSVVVGEDVLVYGRQLSEDVTTMRGSRRLHGVW